MKTVLLWFRNDLRVHDHEALYKAARAGDQIIPLYCFDRRHFKSTTYGFVKSGGHRLRFLRESVKNLRKNLQTLGADLVIRKGKPEVIIPELMDAHNANALFAYGEPADEEQQVENAVKESISAKAHFFWGHSLYHVDDIPYEPSKIPKTFTNFRKQVEKKSSVRDCFSNPPEMQLPDELDAGEIPAASALGLEERNPDKRSVLSFKGGETAAAKRLKHYFWEEDKLKSYKFTRNGLLGADYSSKFSPWLAYGCLSPRKIYAEVKRYEAERKSNVSTYWMIFELTWRDYFRFAYLRHGTDFFSAGGIQHKKQDWNQNDEWFERWKEGQTGIPFVDANMRELRETGFMSNRGRQNVASFLSQNLHLDWRKGAAWFESCLLDYDPYSNYGNWMYNSTVGNDSRNRYFNVVKQAKKYDEDGDFVKQWLPELQAVPTEKIQEPHTLTKAEQNHIGITIGEDYPAPMIDMEASYQRIRERQ